jgi:hypothetical protein
MLLGLDHVVLACADPDETASALESRLGLAAAGGGLHPDHGTRNRLIWLGDSYLELIGIVDAELATRSWLGRPVLASLDGDGVGGLVTWAIAVDELDVALRWAPPDAGLVGPVAGERRRPDGRVVRWRVVHPDAPSTTAPILIEHDVSAAEWSPEERAARAEEQHPLGGRARLLSLEVQTASPAVAAGRLRSVLAASVEPAGRAAVRVRLGRQEVRFVASRPGSSAVVDVVADVPLRTRVTKVGDCEIRLRGQAVDGGARPQPDGPAAV